MFRAPAKFRASLTSIKLSARRAPGVKGFDVRHLSALNGTNAIYAEEMYLAWQKDPSSVHASWAAYFKTGSYSAPPTLGVTESVAHRGSVGHVGPAGDTAKALHLIAGFQNRGHQCADIDPLGLRDLTHLPELTPATYGFTEQDWDRGLNLDMEVQNVSGIMSHADVNNDGVTTLRELHEFLSRTYCGTVAMEFSHINSLEKLNWLRERVEVPTTPFTKEEKTKMLRRTAFSEKFEGFLATKFNAAKRFGLEGNESMITGMRAMLDTAREHGVNDVIIGMAHRGRLNVLSNVMKKPREVIFREFVGTDHTSADEDDWSSSGDVKYHLGVSCDSDGVHCNLLPNPSHLECVNPLVVGKAKAKNYYKNDPSSSTTMPIVIHGDAAFAGQGVVMETMQMGGVEYYQTGGTIQLICNNQIGFTANPNQSRSTMYSSDLGKAFGCPIFHVNADDVEAVCRVFKMATDWRQEFKCDVVIDLIGYRRFGHNEIDEPTFTQPLMYQVVNKHPSVLNVYTQSLEAEGVLTKEEIDAVVSGVTSEIEASWENKDTYAADKPFQQGRMWTNMKLPTEMSASEETGVELDVLHKVGAALTTVPEGFELHRALKRNLKAKKQMFETNSGMDWAVGEALAFGTLLLEGNHVRLSGQDVERGTFSHRHALVHDQNTDDNYVFLNHIDPEQPHTFSVANSPLSEFGVLGFELGYSWEHPGSLPIWEGQFGDFVNGAQVIIDQFISTAEAKWLYQSGLVMLLPHGMTGAGPEHSSCRLERFLASSDEDPDVVPPNLHTQEGQMRQVQLNNWQVCNVTTPANYFHVLRRQMHREFRKPLILATPKDLLRHRLAVSDMDEFTPGTSFKRMYSERFPDELKAPKEVRKVVMMSGKLYYELLQARRDAEVDDVAIVSVEQLSPFPFDLVAAEVAKYPNAEVIWAQEEAKNMGPWPFVHDRIMTATRELNGDEVRARYIGRKTMASPAEGYQDVHAVEQAALIAKCLE
jgi:2-oxoglutarate dehydrogenase E1 component